MVEDWTYVVKPHMDRWRCRSALGLSRWRSCWRWQDPRWAVSRPCAGHQLCPLDLEEPVALEAEALESSHEFVQRRGSARHRRHVPRHLANPCVCEAVWTPATILQWGKAEPSLIRWTNHLHYLHQYPSQCAPPPVWTARLWGQPLQTSAEEKNCRVKCS